ncbi:HutD family protein [Pseudomonas sp. KNUC1026]|uniref:HutD family protein n=1 Tax=Pseudomonas sp. KNUC1026 TaxID=2893890 RepID=UPI0022A71E2F|nr:HutD family protein [Pseudomonas sp. KNUC1026]
MLDGPIRDFNLIYRADRYQAALSWLHIEGQLQVDAAPSCIAFCAQGALAVHAGHEHATLGTLDALRIEAGHTPPVLHLRGDAQVCLIRLQPLGPT